MKRTICTLMILLLLTVMAAPAVAAIGITDNTDSSFIPNAVREAYAGSDVTLVRTYSLSADAYDYSTKTNYDLYSYCAMDSIQDLIIQIQPLGYFAYWDDGRVDASYKYYLTPDSVIDYPPMETTGNGEVIYNNPTTSDFLREHETYNISLEAFEFYKQDNLSAHLGNDVNIEKKYFVCDPRNGFTMILYVTNLGDYLYFDNAQISPCLFSEEAFKDYMHFVFEVNSVMFDSDYKFDVCDLSKYTVNSPNYEANANDIPWVPDNLVVYAFLAITLVAIAVIVIPVVIYRKKYKDHNPYEERQGTGFDPEFVVYHTIENHAESLDNPPPIPGTQ